MKPSVLELIKRFPVGLKFLYKDVQQYYNISAAATTHINKWAGIVPRRQAEQQRKLIRDLVKVAIPVSFASIPVIGNSFFILCAWRPSLFLSSHFFQTKYNRSFAQDEYKQRFGAYKNTAEDFWHSIMRNPKDVGLKIEGKDKAGPIFNTLPLYRLFDKLNSTHIPRQQMKNIAKTSGMQFPFLTIVPDAFIRFRLNSIAADIISDDSNLLAEKHQENNCESLTDKEVLDACSLRGLPCDLRQSYGSMRKCLSNYLAMVGPVYTAIGKNDLLKSRDGVMFVIHLQAIRSSLT